MNLLESSYISFCNLDERKDRLHHMTTELNRIGIQAVRQRSFPWKETDYKNPKYRVMYERTPGAIGCFLSQIEVMKTAFEVGVNAMVFEDDLVFASDFKERLDYIGKWLEGKEWDVIWLGGTFHSPAFWHPKGPSKMNPDCSAHLGKDFEHTDDPRIKRTYGCFSTHAYIVNYNSINKILSLLDSVMHLSIGVDWSFLKLEPQLKTFAFVPGSVKQIDNPSNIGNGITKYSGFARLNGTIENSLYWWQDKISDFNPENFDWK